MVGGPVAPASFFTRMHARRVEGSTSPAGFAVSLLLMALAFLILPLGIKLAGVDGKSAFGWLFIKLCAAEHR